MPIRLLVCGGRDYDDRDQAFDLLDRIHRGHGISVVIHGAALGADTLAGEWAEERKVPQKPFPADWDTYGRAAGLIRNRQMIKEGRPDAVLAFPGGRGTKDMVDRAKKAGLKVATPPTRITGAKVTGTPLTLPTHGQAEKAIIAGVGTSVDLFIAHYEISGPGDRLWRQRLAAVVKQAYQLGWQDREGDLLAGIDRVMGKS